MGKVKSAPIKGRKVQIKKQVQEALMVVECDAMMEEFEDAYLVNKMMSPYDPKKKKNKNYEALRNFYNPNYEATTPEEMLAEYERELANDAVDASNAVCNECKESFKALLKYDDEEEKKVVKIAYAKKCKLFNKFDKDGYFKGD